MPQTVNTNDSLQWIFFGISALFVLYQMVCGWQRGMMRQSCQLVALAFSYAAGWFGGPLLAPALRSLGYADFVLSALAGCGLGALVFLIITSMGMIVFKKTAQHETRSARFGSGVGGLLLGMVFGLAFVWAALIGIRLLGTIAQTQIATRRAIAARNQDGKGSPAPSPGIAIRSLAEMKDSLDHGLAGPVIQDVDPLPPKAYAIIDKMTATISSPESAKRFLNYPGAQDLASNPKVTALYDDPSVMKQVKAQDIMGLMKNPSIVKAMNDPVLYAMLKKFELEKALDYALDNPQKETPAGNNN